MANEIRERIVVTASKGGYVASISHSNQQDQTGAGQEDTRKIQVTTSESDLTFQNVTTPGVIAITNLDSTNFIKYGPKSGGSMVEFLRLNPGETHKIRISSPGTTVLRWVADAANVDVQLEALED